MATVKLRKSFHYPGDSSGEDDLPNEMDEEGRGISGGIIGSF